MRLDSLNDLRSRFEKIEWKSCFSENEIYWAFPFAFNIYTNPQVTYSHWTFSFLCFWWRMTLVFKERDL